MSREIVDCESTASGKQATIPALLRRELDIDDGDTFCWHFEDNDTLRVKIVPQ